MIWTEKDGTVLLDCLNHCNMERFNGTNMLANRTIHEFAAFVDAAIFDTKSDEYAFKNLYINKDIFPLRDGANGFVEWGRLFRRWYDSDYIERRVKC